VISRSRAAIAIRLAGMLRPKEKITFLEYSERYGYIVDGTHGTQKFRCRPYQRDWFLGATDPEVQCVVCQKPARIGWSEYIKQLLQFFCYWKPSKIMIVQPTDSEVAAYSKEDIDPLFADNTGVPVLAGLLGNKKSKTDTRNSYNFKQLNNGALIHLVNAATPRSARRVARNCIFFEEPATYDSPEGHTIKNFLKRAGTFWDPFFTIGGTPIEPGDYMDQCFKMGDQQYRYYPCPHCNTYQQLAWERFVKEGPDAGRFQCENCEELIENRYLSWMDEQGGWACPLGLDRSAQILRDGVPIWRSFQVDAGMGYHPDAAWTEVVSRHQAALQQMQKGDTDDMQTFCNTDRGRPWQDTLATKITADNLGKRRLEIAHGNGYGPVNSDPWRVPNGVLLVTAGGDTQGGGGTAGQRLVVTVWGWGRGEEGWHLGHFEIDGDPQDPVVLSQLDQIASTVWIREDGARLTMGKGLQDEAGLEASMHAIRAHLAGGPGVWSPCRGAPQPGKALLGKPFSAEINHKGQIVKRGIEVHWVGYQESVKHLHNRLRVSAPGPGYLHFGNELISTDQYLKELFPWRRVPVRKGGQTAYKWGDPPAGHRDEGGDCTRYAIAARELVARGYNRATMWDQLEAAALASIGEQKPDRLLSALRFA
jgi:phage terminase large subunit GpA-like protein